jgi:hypothetical protein
MGAFLFKGVGSMKFFKGFVATTIMFFTLSATAQNTIKDINERLEQAGKDATARYAASVNKPAPELKDYRYGMEVDVAKLVHVSQNVKYCGTVKSLMGYEDSKGELHLVRYLVSGTCVNNR